MILYHPGYDVNHCVYRVVNILFSTKMSVINEKSLSLIDFYYVYPHLLQKIENLPRPINKFKNDIDLISEPFEITPNPKSLYYELKSTQLTAISFLKQKNLISNSSREVSINKDLLPTHLIEKIEKDPFRDSQIFKMLSDYFPKVKLEGKNGFKDRSGLMEFKYD